MCVLGCGFYGLHLTPHTTGGPLRMWKTSNRCTWYPFIFDQDRSNEKRHTIGYFMFLTAANIQYLLRPPTGEFRTSIHRILVLLHFVLLYRKTINLAINRDGTMQVPFPYPPFPMSSPMQIEHNNTGTHFFLIIAFTSQRIMYHPIPEYWIKTQGSAAYSTSSQHRLPCVWRWCVQREGCVRRCGVPALCVCCV